jgi:alkyl hydroperoxide reductase subunit AhpC
MDEIVRVVDALLLSAEKSVATPANWPNNHADQVRHSHANLRTFATGTRH